MRRRTFCAAGIAALATASFPYRRVLGAVSGELGAIGLDGKQLTLSAADIADLRAALRGELLTAQRGAQVGNVGGAQRQLLAIEPDSSELAADGAED
ncbi:MAG TPA: hypothetical protein VMU79_02545, partial [Casimicrobiaceae bacterium]|nr:hypothetical protein [Casimicrobiaceae bacterium]